MSPPLSDYRDPYAECDVGLGSAAFYGRVMHLPGDSSVRSRAGRAFMSSRHEQEKCRMERLSQKMELMELSVLLIEDSEPDSELAIRRLDAAGFKCSYRRVINEQEMRSALKGGLPDLILWVLILPGLGGMPAFAVARVGAPNVPFFFLPGTIGEGVAIEALRGGAIDYVLKRNLMGLVPAVK